MSEKFVVKSACEAGLVIKYIGALVSVILLLFFIVITFTQTKVNARSLYHNKLKCLSPPPLVPSWHQFHQHIYVRLFCTNDKKAAFCWLPNAKKSFEDFLRTEL
jgi:hypothetical protein